MATRQSRTRDPRFEASLDDCLVEFQPVAREHGLALRSRATTAHGFDAEFWRGDEVGIALAYHIRDPFTVDILLTEGIPHRIDLLDLVAEAGLPEPLPRIDYFSIPDRQVAAVLAAACRQAAGPLLNGDRTLVPGVLRRQHDRLTQPDVPPPP